MDTGLSYFVDRQDMAGVDELIDSLLNRPLPVATHEDYYPKGGMSIPSGHGVKKEGVTKRYSGIAVHRLNL